MAFWSQLSKEEKRTKYVGVEATTNFECVEYEIQSDLSTKNPQAAPDPPLPGSLDYVLQQRAPLEDVQAAYHKDPSALTYELLAKELRLCSCSGRAEPFPDGVLDFLFHKFKDSSSMNVGKLMVNILIKWEGGLQPPVQPVEILQIIVPKGLQQLQLQGCQVDLDNCLEIAILRPRQFLSYWKLPGGNGIQVVVDNHDFCDFLSQQLAPYIEHLHHYYSFGDDHVPETHFLLQGGNLRSFYLDCDRFGPQHLRPILQAVWESTSITDFFLPIPNENAWTSQRHDAVRDLMTEICHWDPNPDSAIQTFRIDFCGPVTRLEVEAFVSWARKMPRLSNLELTFFGTEVSIDRTSLSELVTQSQTLTTLKVTAAPYYRDPFFMHMTEALATSPSLTRVVIDGEDMDFPEPYDAAAEFLGKILSLLESVQRLQQFTVDNYKVVQEGKPNKQIVKPFHPLVLDIEFLCAKRRYKQLSENVNDVTNEDIYESVETALNDDHTCPQEECKPHKLAIITSVLYENVRNNNDAWVSIIPSLYFAPNP